MRASSFSVYLQVTEWSSWRLCSQLVSWSSLLQELCCVFVTEGVNKVGNAVRGFPLTPLTGDLKVSHGAGENAFFAHVTDITNKCTIELVDHFNLSRVKKVLLSSVIKLLKPLSSFLKAEHQSYCPSPKRPSRLHELIVLFWSRTGLGRWPDGVRWRLWCCASKCEYSRVRARRRVCVNRTFCSCLRHLLFYPLCGVPNPSGMATVLGVRLHWHQRQL